MRLVNFKEDSAYRLGVVTDAGVLDVAAAVAALGEQGVASSPAELLAAGRAGLQGLRALLDVAAREPDRVAGLYFSESSLTLGPCVLQPEKIICVGLNYVRHAKESGMEIPATPVLFSKFTNSLAGHGQVVPLPKGARQYDYEVELAVVIGRQARDVAVEDAGDYVLGYATSNDLSARDLQMRTSQWLLGKTLDGFLPIGPYLVSYEEVPDPGVLDVKCWLNGELRQDSNTRDMVFSVPELISYLSRYMTLVPGDVICTGTPEGVILGREEKDWIKEGDSITVEVGGLGKLTNTFVNA